MKKTLPFVAAALAAAFVAGNYAGADDKAHGKIKGKVLYGGDMSKANVIDKTDKDHEACGKERPKPALIVDGSKGLADAVIYVKGKAAGEFTAAQKNAVLDQKSCTIDPHVILVAEGGEVEFKNSDSVLHNISYSSTNNGTFNQGIGAGKSVKQKMNKAEFITLSCSVHPWMSGLLVVMQNPYYTVSKPSGEFELELPAGKHTIIVQHQTLGKVDKKGLEVEVKAGETKNLDPFEFK